MIRYIVMCCNTIEHSHIQLNCTVGKLSTCEVLLSELDQGEDHAVSHLVGELRVEGVQLHQAKQKHQGHDKDTH